MKSVLVHSAAQVDPSAIIGKNVKIGPYSIIGPNVKVGDNTRIGPHVFIERNTVIGAHSVIHKGAALGVDPLDAKYQGEDTWLEIGERAVLREYCTVSRGSSGRTEIGRDFMLMCQGHVSHDCKIGDNVILSNAVNLLDHVWVEDRVIIGGLTFVNRHCRIGTLSFVGGGFRVALDVPPFVIAGDEPLQITAVNAVALKKFGYTDGQIGSVTQAYKILHAHRDNVPLALEKLKNEVTSTEETNRILKFVQESERGII
jgi:UDP-N-acetylglucosamine acyltransferase